MPLIIPSNTITGGYEVANSCRFDNASSDYLNRTQGGAGNRQTWTFSTWIKICKRQGDRGIFSYYDDDNNFGKIGLQGDYNQLVVNSRTSGTYHSLLTTTAYLRDFNGWYNIIVAADTTQSTAANRIKIYINGILQTVSGTLPSQNHNLEFNTTDANYISNWNGSSQELDGYLAETVFIDGSQLDQTSFGEFDEDSPTIWKPIDVSGLTFGTYGFYLDYEDSSALGNDKAGSNNFSVNNLTAVDQSIDTCTNNFAVINRLTPATATITEGNLKFANSETNHKGVVGTFGASSGKWYCEIKTTDVSDSTHVGIIDIEQQSDTPGNTTGYSSRGYSLSHERDVYNNNGIISGYTDWTGTYGDGDILGIAMDLDNDKLYFSKGGQWSAGDGTWGSTTFNASTGAIPITAGYTYTFGASVYNGNSEFNFGSAAFSISSGNADSRGHGNFEYAVPSGFFALCTKNLAEFG